MSWVISKINNATHEVSMTHPDGEVMDLIIPVESRISSTAKLAYLKAQTEIRNVIKEAEAEAQLVEAKIIESKAIRKSWLLYAILVAETIALIGLLIHGK